MIVQLVLLLITSSVSSQLLHHAMTSEELGQIFSVESVSEVPNYDIMPISVLKPRNRRDIESFLMTKPFEERKFRIWLHPTDSTLISRNVPICNMSYTDDDNNNDYDSTKISMKCQKDMLKNFKIYENANHATSVSIDKNSKGKHFVKGFIGNKYIHPVPPHLINHARRHRRSIGKSFEHESDDEIYHILYDIPQSHKDMLSSPLRNTRAAEWIYNKKIKVPDTIYPEILVIVDYGWSQIVKYKSQIDQLKYLIAFWNGVDFRYRSLNNPKVRLNIARIVFAMDKKVLDYMNPYEKPDPITKLPILRNGSSALRNKGMWLYQINKTIPIDSYDVAITMFTNNICPEGSKIAKSKCINIGLAFTSCACYTQDYYNITYKVGFVQDLGNYWGIQTAAHELGHLFGSYHDNITENGCRNEDNYIMATSNWKTENSFDWSECSISQMNRFFRNRSWRAICLFNKPLYRDQSIRRPLPGQLMPITAQCENFWNGTVDGNYTEGIDCRRVSCKQSDGSYLLIEPAEGTTCGSQKICLHGQCVSTKSDGKDSTA